MVKVSLQLKFQNSFKNPVRGKTISFKLIAYAQGLASARKKIDPCINYMY